MSDETEPIAPPEQTVKPLSHSRILKLMGLLGLAGSIVGAVGVDLKFGLGVAVGTVLALLNYFWLRHSLRKVFEAAAATGEKPRLLGLRYVGRYLVLAAVVALFYATNAVSIVGLILGLGAFGFAVVFEGLFNIFSRPGNEGEN